MSEQFRRRLSFVVVGAQKAGTTTLHNALRRGQGVLVPPSKEAPFFAVDEDYRRGEEWFFETFFPNADSGAVMGSVTPQYMYVPIAVDRLFEHNPELMILAMLRDPIDRAVSHYQMNLRRGIESRGIDEALTSAFSYDPHEYLLRGRYGHLLERWVSKFGTEQLSLLDFEWLANDPEHLARTLEATIGAKVAMDELGRVANSSSRLAATESLKRLLGSNTLRPLRRVVSVRARQTLWFRLEEGISVRGGQRAHPSAEVVAELQGWFHGDSRTVARLWSRCSSSPLPTWVTLQ